MFSGVSSGLVVKTAKIAAPITRSSVISTADIEIYKNKGITLSSAQSYRSRYLGYQQWPWMANIDTVAVWTKSGEVFANWKDRSHSNSNTHLPYLKQDKNVALIMYRPIKNLALYGFGDFDVALYWSDSSFEETRTYGGHWLMGRVGDSYVAVRRGCDNGMINGWPACSNDTHQA